MVDPSPSESEQNSVPTEPSRALMVRNGRYAIEVESVHGPNTHVPNDIYAADGKNFTVITGINGSGKVCTINLNSHSVSRDKSDTFHWSLYVVLNLPFS